MAWGPLALKSHATGNSNTHTNACHAHTYPQPNLAQHPYIHLTTQPDQHGDAGNHAVWGRHRLQPTVADPWGHHPWGWRIYGIALSSQEASSQRAFGTDAAREFDVRGSGIVFIDLTWEEPGGKNAFIARDELNWSAHKEQN